MRSNYNLEELREIRPIEVPSFVFTRIEAQIEKEESIEMPRQWAWGLTLACSILLVVNISFFVNSNENSVAQTESTSLLEAVGLESSNQLYYE
ncbi:MAG: hypothetical protein ACPG19_10365 [Saprospiraceae bacterium]